MNQIKHIHALSELNRQGISLWNADKIAKQYQVPVRHIHDVLRTEIPVFDNIEDEKKFNEISQKKFIMTSTHQNLTNVFSQFKVVKKPIKMRTQVDPIPTLAQKLEDG